MADYGKIHAQLSDMFHLRTLNKIFFFLSTEIVYTTPPQKKKKTA